MIARMGRGTDRFERHVLTIARRAERVGAVQRHPRLDSDGPLVANSNGIVLDRALLDTLRRCRRGVGLATGLRQWRAGWRGRRWGRS